MVSPFATPAGGAPAGPSFVGTHDAATAAPVLRPPARHALEKVGRWLLGSSCSPGA